MAAPRTPSPTDVERDGPTMAWWRGAVIGSLALLMASGSLLLLWLLARPLTLLLLAIVIACALMPTVHRLERWLPRGVAIVLIYAALALMLGGLGWLVLPPLVAEGRALVLNSPELIERSRVWLNGVDPEGADRIIAAAQSAMGRFTNVLISLPLMVVSSVIDVILVAFMSIYWLIATSSLRRFTLSLFPSDARGRADATLGAMGDTMGGYVRATAVNGLIIGVMTYIGLLIIGVEYPLVLAVLAGIGELLPVIGPVLAAIPAIAIASVDSLQQAVVVTIFFILLQQLESNLLVPFIMRKQADVPPLLSLFAILAGSTLGGAWGALVAIPLAGALRVLILQVVVPAEREWTAPDGDTERARGRGSPHR